MSNVDRRAKIAVAADRAFYRDGFASVGIDQIASEAEVALGTLYRHYRGKSDLVIGALTHRERLFFAFVERSAHGLEGEARVLDLFASLHAWAESQVAANGCLFHRAASAHPKDAAVRAVALAHKRAYLELVRRRLLEGGWTAAQAENLAPALFVLLEGLTASAALLGGNAAKDQATAMARALLSAEPRSGGQPRRSRPAANR